MFLSLVLSWPVIKFAIGITRFSFFIVSIPRQLLSFKLLKDSEKAFACAIVWQKATALFIGFGSEINSSLFISDGIFDSAVTAPIIFAESSSVLKFLIGKFNLAISFLFTVKTTIL